MGFTLILSTLDGLDVGLLGDVIGEDDCDDDVQLILKLLGKRHGKCTDFVRAVRKIIDSFEELRQHKQVDGVIALRQTGCIADGEAALPPSKRLHLALEVMSANVAEDERIPPGGPSALKTFANGTAKTVSVLEIQNLPPMLLRTKSLPLNAMIPLLSLWHIVLRNVNPISSNRESGAVLHDVNLLHSSPQKSCNDNAILEDTEATYKANMEVDNFSSLTNVAELKIVVPGPENRRNAALTSFEASLAALTRTKKTIDRSTRLAIDCAKFLALRLIVLNLVLLLRKSFAVADTRFIIQNWYFVVLSATVVVKGLSQKTTEEDLHQILSEWGPLRHVRVIKERNSGTSRGFAFIDFPSTGSARSMMDKVGDEGVVVDGRKLFFEYSSKPTGSAGGPFFGSDGSSRSGHMNHRTTLLFKL
ncbi:suppressor of ABI3-5 isoform X1 [Tanacetum coccineum]|uniref:Suppressor of ABI3-5 isoform X1 n=1 Tax=Tanacetum coccineum TaxID=301880 RepID=A0ABQ4X0U7_9ASTR